MKRFTTTLLALAIGLPLSAAAAEPNVDQKTPEAVIVAAGEDAVVLPAAPAARTEKREERERRLVPRGSSQSEGGFRFTNPYAFPQQTLPVQFPSFSTFSF
jgi:hypothetical protein